HTPVRLDRLWTRRSTLPTPLSTPHTSYTLSLHDALPISMDKADGSGTLLFDLAARDWSDEVLRALEVPRAWLPPTHEGPSVTGRITAAAAAETGLAEGTPVMAGGGDQAAGAVGAGAIAPGVVS